MLVVESEYRKIARYIVFMQMAEKLSNLSCDPKHQVAAILVKKDFKSIISIGFNGTRPGAPNVRTNMDSGQSGFRHAEHNCLTMANISGSPKDYMLFCTLSPCESCAGDLAVKEIDTVFYKDRYPSGYKAGDDAMKAANIQSVCIWDKLEQMFKDLIHFEMVQYKSFESSVMSDDGVRILAKKHLEKFGMPFNENIDFTDWKYDYPKHFIQYLYSVT